MTLQTTFYIMGIIVMSITLVLLIILVVAVLYIRNKVSALHKLLDEKIELVTNIISPVTRLTKTVNEVKKSVRPKK